MFSRNMFRGKPRPKITKWGRPPIVTYRRDGGCSNCGGVRDSTGRYCLACKRAYIRAAGRGVQSALQRAKSIARAYARVYLRRGKINAGAVRGVRSREGSDASRRLLEAAPGPMAMRSMPYRSPRGSRRNVNIFCDGCANFEVWKGEADALPARYNPCSKKHRMSFRMPTSPISDDWGFYRLVCEDRAVVCRWRPGVPAFILREEARNCGQLADL